MAHAIITFFFLFFPFFFKKKKKKGASTRAIGISVDGLSDTLRILNQDHIPQLGHRAATLTDLLTEHKRFVWSTRCQRAFDDLTRSIRC